MNIRRVAIGVLVLFLFCGPTRAEDLKAYLDAKGVINLKLTLDDQGKPISVKAGNVTDEVLERLGREVSLTSLEVSGTFTDGGVAQLAKLSRLKKLLLSGSITSDWGVPLKGSLPELEALTMNGSKTVEDKKIFLFPRKTGEAFRYIPDFPKLKSFNPGTNHVYYFNNEAIRFLATPTMEVLRMAGSTAGEKTLDYSPLARCVSLKLLQIPQATDNDSLGQSIHRLPNLKKLCLYLNTDKILPYLVQIQSLEDLEGRECNFSAEGIKQLALLPNLARINFSAALNRDQLLALKEIKSLKSAQITVVSLESVDELKALRPDLKIAATMKGEKGKSKQKPKQ